MSRKEFFSKKRLTEITRDGVQLRIYKERPNNLDQMFRKTARRFPNREAVIDGNQRLNYRELDLLADRVASALLQKFKLKPKDRVAFLMGNHYRWPIVFLALARAGVISVPLNNRLQGPEITYQLNDSQSRILIIDQAFLGRVDGLENQSKHLDCIIVNGQIDSNNFMSFSELEEYEALNVANDCDEEEPACILYTSGTTGFPKGAVLSHRNMIAVAMCCADMLRYEETDRMLFFIPLFHVTGLVAMLIAMFLVGGANIIMPSFDRHKIPEIIEKEKITATMGVPATFILIMDSPNFQKFSRRSMRSILYGGSPAPPEMHRKLKDSLPQDCILVEGYGLTEASSNVLISPVEEDRSVSHHYGTIGVVNYFSDLRVVDGQGRDVAPGEVGELWVRAPGVCQGYWNDPEKTTETIKDGWLATGDLVSQDEEGYYAMKGRSKQMINRGGENIYPVEIENVLYSHPNVLEAAVVGVPDKVMGEEVKAVIVPKDMKTYSQDEMRKFLKKNLADYKVPRFLATTDQLPRNPGGKVIVKEIIGI